MDVKKYENLNPALLREIVGAGIDSPVVLDVGCWSGVLGHALKENLACTVEGVDKTAIPSEYLQRDYAAVHHFDLENADGLARLGQYDIIVLGDVLEHLADPGSVLAALAGHLTARGFMLASIPNIAFILYRVTHLFGSWEYRENGIMDRTHLRFFTKKTARRLFADNGLRVVRGYGLSMVRNRYFFLRWLARILPGLFALNYVIKAEKARN